MVSDFRFDPARAPGYSPSLLLLPQLVLWTDCPA
jgi:hypothetical protein